MTDDCARKLARLYRAAVSRVSESLQARDAFGHALMLHMKEHGLKEFPVGDDTIVLATDYSARAPACHFGSMHPVRDGVWTTCPRKPSQRLEIKRGAA